MKVAINPTGIAEGKRLRKTSEVARHHSKWAVASLAVIAVGALGAVLMAGLIEMPAGQALTLAAYTGLGGVAAGVLGAAALVVCRRRSIGVQAAVVAMTAVAAVASGAVVAAIAMFISRHDLRALGVVLVTGATFGVLIALVLGDRVARSARSITATARRIGTGDFTTPPESRPTGEFGPLARELEEMSSRLGESLDRERKLEASRRELVSWVSHDLRTPLAGLRAMAEALEDGVVSDPETVVRYHRSMRAEVDRLTVLVDDLFELSRINAGTLQLELEKASLTDLVSDALAAASGVAQAKGVTLTGRLDGPTPDLQLSALEMTRVLRNILENAIRHTPGEGEVIVETGADPTHAFVRVADECGGIPSPEIERVFETAFRGEAARTPGGNGGSGLGLAIARGIVEAHRGEIEVANEAAGCAFTIRLPLSR
jgi:signal transduction histidine kinase